MVLLFLKVLGIDSSMGCRFGQPLCLTPTAKEGKGPYHVGCFRRGKGPFLGYRERLLLAPKQTLTHHRTRNIMTTLSGIRDDGTL